MFVAYATIARSWASRAGLIFTAIVTILTAPTKTYAQTQQSDGTPPFLCKPEMAAPIVTLIDNKAYPQALDAATAFVATATRELGKNSSCTAQALYFQGTARLLTGRFEESGPPLDEAVATLRRTLPSDHPALMFALNNQGAQRFWMRRYEEAAKIHEEALDVRRRAVPPDDGAIATSLHNLADAYRYREPATDPAVLIGLYTEVVALRTRLNSANHPLVAQSRLNLASAYEMARDTAAAQAQLTEALRIYRLAQPRDDAPIATALNRLAIVQFTRGDFAAAELLYGEALAILRNPDTGQKLALAAALDNFALNQMRQNKLEPARALAGEALGVRAALLPPTHQTIARTLSNVTEIDWLHGRFAESLELSRKATEITLLAPKLDTAARLRLQRHVRAIWWSGGKPEGPKPGGAYTAELLDEAFRISQHAMRSTTGSTVRNSAARAATSDPRVRALLKDIDDIELEQARLEHRLTHAAALTGADATRLFADTRVALTAVAARRAALLIEVRRTVPRYDQLVRPEPIGIAEVQGLLRTDEAMVTLFVGPDEIYAFAITRDAAAMRQVRLTPQGLAATVGQLRQALHVEPTAPLPPGQGLFSLASAHDLHTKLLGDFDAMIGKKANLVIVPSGSLTSLPFHLLVRTRPRIAEPTRLQAVAYREADWLARRQAVTVLPSVESMKALRTSPPSAAAKPLLAFANPLPRAEPGRVEPSLTPVRTTRGARLRRGDPVFWTGTQVRVDELRAFLAKEPLVETVAEVRAVAAALRADPNDVLTGSAATVSALKRLDLSQYRVMYFATHGFVSGQFGAAEPALALTVPDTPTEEDTGLLTASEIAGLTLDADLVVLSACDTAAGDTVGADGLSGLARAFFHAGARSLLVSHWSVDSLDTDALMQALFREQLRQPNVARSEALRRAMLGRLTSATGKDVWNAYPGRWAPFDLVGGK